MLFNSEQAYYCNNLILFLFTRNTVVHVIERVEEVALASNGRNLTIVVTSPTLEKSGSRRYVHKPTLLFGNLTENMRVKLL